jgi:hypothetical protein
MYIVQVLARFGICPSLGTIATAPSPASIAGAASGGNGGKGHHQPLGSELAGA